MISSIFNIRVKKKNLLIHISEIQSYLIINCLEKHLIEHNEIFISQKFILRVYFRDTQSFFFNYLYSLSIFYSKILSSEK